MIIMMLKNSYMVLKDNKNHILYILSQQEKKFDYILIIGHCPNKLESNKRLAHIHALHVEVTTTG